MKHRVLLALVVLAVAVASAAALPPGGAIAVACALPPGTLLTMWGASYTCRGLARTLGKGDVYGWQAIYE